ncbi:uncharacterized protein LOC128037420 [Gossypium raimondii]|uniref:uncharacterized protein LOC128037420 n=1 Tax=Gossypium raimondii TaxID=29730 RepID=UPI00227A6BC3|nr:uncharacterized protein LOC128037420 [Gossypium raimondii]
MGKKEQMKGKAVEVEPLVNEPIKEEEAKEFFKFLKHSEYSIVEKLRKQSARISILALLLSSEEHRNALLKVLNETYVADDISVNKLDRLVNNISADNFIFFSDDEIPSGGRGSTKALHVTARCKGYTLPGVLVDNGSALNVLPLSTLSWLSVDSSHMKVCQSIVRAFDGTKKRVIGRIEVPLRIGPITYEVEFLVMDIKPSYNCLLGRPWIHSAGAVPSSLLQKVKIVLEGRVITINAEEDIIATVTSDAPYVEIDEETIECSFQSLEFVNAMFIAEGSRILVPKISRTTEMGLRLMIGRGASPGKVLGKYLQGKIEAPILKEKFDSYGLGYKPDMKQKNKEVEKRQGRRRARLSGKEVKWEPMSFPYIFTSFVSGGFIHPERGVSRSEDIEEMLENVHVNSIETSGKRALLEICPYEPGSELNNWTAEEIPDEQILPYRESLEIVSLEEGKDVKIGTEIAAKTKQDLTELLREFKDVFAWSYQNMPRLSTSVVVHRFPIKEDYKPVQQKLRRMRPDVVLKIKEEVKRQFNAGFLQEIKYSDWVANIVPVPKKDRNMHPEDMGKTTFITLWGTFCYKVMPFGLKNAGAIYQRAMVTLFHDIMHKEVEVYVDDMIAKSRTEEEHVQVLKRLFLRLRIFQLKLNPAKCTFGARSGKLLGFIVSKKGIEVDPDKVKAIRDLPPPRTKKEV